MNKRIRELANEARIEVGQRIGYNDRDRDNEFEELFAELIVRECAGIYDKIDNGNLHMGTDDYLEALHKTFRS